jgi:hypothetical protein
MRFGDSQVACALFTRELAVDCYNLRAQRFAEGEGNPPPLPLPASLTPRDIPPLPLIASVIRRIPGGFADLCQLSLKQIYSVSRAATASESAFAAERESPAES